MLCQHNPNPGRPVHGRPGAHLIFGRPPLSHFGRPLPHSILESDELQIIYPLE